MTNSASKKLQIYFFVSIFLITIGLMFFIFKPFLSAITISAIIAVVLYPWYQWVVRLLRGHEGLAAFIIITLMLVVVIVPFAFIGKQIFNETLSVYQYLSSPNGVRFDQLPQTVEDLLQKFAPDFNLELNTYIKQAVGWLMGNLGHLFSGTVEVIFGLFLIIISLYFFLKDGKKLKDWLIKISPLDDRYDQTILNRIRQMIYSVVVGTFAIAVVQGILVGLGLFIFRVPNVMLWGMVAGLSALVPGLGTGLVTVPAVLYLFFLGSLPAAIGLGIWSLILVGLVDNILLPFFYSHGNHIHPLLILFSVLGGLAAFGPVGFLLGPIILSIFLALLQIYQLLRDTK